MTMPDWGYDRDIAESLSNIDKNLERFVDLFERREDRDKEREQEEFAVSQETFKKELLGALFSNTIMFAKALTEILDEEDAFLKAKKLRELCDTVIKTGDSISEELDKLVGKDEFDGQVNEAWRGRTIRQN